MAFRNKHSDILALAWKDKRVVSMISTCHNANTQEIRRTGKNNIVEVVNKPVVICDYTAKMGGVDRSDHYCTSYSFARKSLKWCCKLYFWILEMSVVNSFILYNMERSKNNLRPVSHMAYRKELIKLLVSDVRNLHPKRGPPTSLDSESSVRMNGLYHSIKISEGKKPRIVLSVLTEKYLVEEKRLHSTVIPVPENLASIPTGVSTGITRRKIIRSDGL